jgi:hypothetical protein
MAERWRLALLVVVIGGLVGFSVVSTNTLGAADRLERLAARVELFLDPPPDRPTLPTVVVTAQPSPVAPVEPDEKVIARSEPYAGANEIGPRGRAPVPTPTPIVRQPVTVSLVENPEAVFISQNTPEMCAVAGTQMALAILGLGDTSVEFQDEIAGRIGEWETWEDSHDGGWGPAAVGEALASYGASGYEVRAYVSHVDAMRGIATAISATGKPVVLFPWWGAHTWVITGYEADADPLVFPDANVSGFYVLDPWYPRVSNIWGPSDPPGNFEDVAELERNWPTGTPMGFGPGWSRPEGLYPDRDGKFVVLIPTTPRDG